MSNESPSHGGPNPFDMVRVEEIASGTYRSHLIPGPYGRIFGGQLVGQAVYAAALTVADARQPHSFRCSFLRRGTTELPTEYMVETLRDGRAFSVRQVRALQGDRVLMIATISFHEGRPGLEHQIALPDGYPEPEQIDVSPDEETAGNTPHRKAVEIRRVPHHASPTSDSPHSKAVWLRLKTQQLDLDRRTRSAAIALCSDFTILEAVVFGHGLTFADPRLTVASLDHAFWWHEDDALDDWLLFVQTSPWAGRERGLASGHIYSRQGVLLASTAQEGLVKIDS